MRDIIDKVRDEGDVAVRNFCREFDGVEVGNIDITDQAERAAEEIDDEVREAIEDAAANIREFHEAPTTRGLARDLDGRELGRRFRPLERVGVYDPAARPPTLERADGRHPGEGGGRGPSCRRHTPGEPENPITLAAIHIAGADRYTESAAHKPSLHCLRNRNNPRVEKVVGPGNKWVTAAKAEVQGRRGNRHPRGTKRIARRLADESADPAFVASDVVAQAEHDQNAASSTVTDDQEFAAEVAKEIEEQAGEREREDMIHEALENDASGLFVARSMCEALLFAEEYAAEHLSIQASRRRGLLSTDLKRRKRLPWPVHAGRCG